jgi:hypothetical protein
MASRRNSAELFFVAARAHWQSPRADLRCPTRPPYVRNKYSDDCTLRSTTRHSHVEPHHAKRLFVFSRVGRTLATRFRVLRQRRCLSLLMRFRSLAHRHTHTHTLTRTHVSTVQHSAHPATETHATQNTLPSYTHAHTRTTRTRARLKLAQTVDLWWSNTGRKESAAATPSPRSQPGLRARTRPCRQSTGCGHSSRCSTRRCPNAT